MPKKNVEEMHERELSSKINDKLEILILLTSVQRENPEKVKARNKYRGKLSKREVERLTGVDRREL